MPERKAKTDLKRDPNFVYKVQSNESEMEDNSEEIDSQIYASIAAINNDPTNYKEASESKDRDKWLMTINEELQSTTENDVWEIVDRPAQVKWKKIQRR